MILEEHIEEAIKSLAGANTTLKAMVTAGTLVIRDWRDNSASKAGQMVVVHAEPAERIAPNSNYWRVPVSAVAATHQADDKSRGTCESIYQQLQTVMGNATKITIGNNLPAGSSVTVDGIVMRQGEEGFDESHQMLAVKADIYATIAP
jgi:hypothetical protein